MTNGFAKLNLNSQITENISNMGYNNPTKIQTQLVGFFDTNTDIIAISKSGTGKTGAYLLPIINDILNTKHTDFLSTLIVVPTKILVEQVSMMLHKYSQNCGIKHKKLLNKQEIHMDGINIVITTPNRLNMSIKDGNIDISAVKTIVIDEADMVFGDGFLDELRQIYAQLSKRTKTILLSATISQNIKYIAKEFLKEYRTINISLKQDIINHIKYTAYKVDKKQKLNLLVHLLKTSQGKCMVFFNSTQTVDEMSEMLAQLDIEFVTYHGELSSQNRARNIGKFKQDCVKIALCSNIASRGLDIDDITLVINYDLPDKIDDFTHRCGRTGRAGRYGEAVSLLTTAEYKKFDTITNRLKLSIKREVHDKFELKEYQPKQRQKSKTISKKKQKRLSASKSDKGAKQTTKKKYRTKRT